MVFACIKETLSKYGLGKRMSDYVLSFISLRIQGRALLSKLYSQSEYKASL